MILAVGLSSSAQKCEPTPVVAQDLDNTFVKIEKGPITSVSADPRDEFFNELFGEPRVTHVGDLIKVLERVANIRIHGVFMEIKNLQSSLTTISELRRAMVKFRASEKPLWVTVHDVDMPATCWPLLQPSEPFPLGGAMLPGPMFQLTYFGPALKSWELKSKSSARVNTKARWNHWSTMCPGSAREAYEAMEESLQRLS